MCCVIQIFTLKISYFVKSDKHVQNNKDLHHDKAYSTESILDHCNVQQAIRRTNSQYNQDSMFIGCDSDSESKFPNTSHTIYIHEK